MRAPFPVVRALPARLCLNMRASYAVMPARRSPFSSADRLCYSAMRHIAKKTTSHPWWLDAQPHRAVEAPAGLKACFEPLFSTSSPALSRGHYDSLSTPRLDKFCEPMGWPPAQPSFSGAPSPTVRRDRESTKSPLLLAAARAMQFLSPRACCRRGAKVSCSAGGCLSHGVMMQRVCC